MQAPPLHPEEGRRLAALRALGVLDTPPEERFDRLTRLAAALFQAPTALVSLVDEGRQWFKSRQGLPASETPRDISFCGHAILGQAPLVVPDALADTRFADNPLVTGDPRIRFYVGQPLLAPGGLPMGTLCVLDRVPREIHPEQLSALADLAHLVERELALRDWETALGGATQTASTEFLYQTMLDTPDEGIILQGSDGRIVLANARAGEILGLTLDQLLGRTSLDPRWRCIHPDGSPWPGDAHPSMVTLATGQAQHDIPMGVQKPDGTLTWIQINTRLVRGGPAGVVVSYRDVTATWEATRALETQEALYRLLVERTTDIIARHGTDGAFLFVTPSVQMVLGYAPEELTGRLPTAFLVPEDIPIMVAAHQAILRGEPVGTFRFRARHHDGGLVWLETEGSPILDPEGRVTEVVFTSRDISLRVAAEEDLRELTTRHRAMMEALPDQLFRQSDAGIFLDVQGVHPALEGQARERMIGHPLEAFFPEETALLLRGALRRALDAGEVQVEEYQLTVEGRRLDFEARVVPSGPREVVTIVRDITERNLVDRLKSEFVSTVSHELRTPLTAIRGALGLLAGGVAGALNAQAQDLISMADKNADRLVRLINDLLDLDKIARGQLAFSFQEADLGALVSQVVASLTPLAEQTRVTLRLEREPSELKALVDPDRFAQVVLNVAGNALKFSSEGGQVILRTQHDGDFAMVEVEDHGPGIPPGFRDRIFQRFSQADSGSNRQKGGTGLGLSIAKALTEHMGGVLDFTSQPGRTVFRLRFPLAKHRRAYRVLLLEDDALVGGAIQCLLQEWGLEVHLADGAAAARAALAHTSMDLLLLDLRLQDEDGLTFLQGLRAEEAWRDLPVLVVSGHLEDRATQRGLTALQVLDWIPKPFDPAQLVQLVMTALEGTRHQPRLLHVEDSPDVATIVSLVLRPLAEVASVRTLGEARTVLAGGRPDLVILDLTLPDGWGLDLLPDLERLPGPPIPVVVFSAREPGPIQSQQVAAVLVKAQTTNQDLRTTIERLLPGGK